MNTGAFKADMRIYHNERCRTHKVKNNRQDRSKDTVMEICNLMHNFHFAMSQNS